MNSKPCIWNGIVYPSISAAARDNWCHVDTMRGWLARGWRCDADIPPPRRGNGTPCVWNGVNYGTIAAAAEAQSITHQAMSQRLRNGYTCDADMKQLRIENDDPLSA